MLRAFIADCYDPCLDDVHTEINRIKGLNAIAQPNIPYCQIKEKIDAIYTIPDLRHRCDTRCGACGANWQIV